ncbi:hypothetical protein JCM11641_004693 [Rhodosporidiobolus odoratus]
MNSTSPDLARHRHSAPQQPHQPHQTYSSYPGAQVDRHSPQAQYASANGYANGIGGGQASGRPRSPASVAGVGGGGGAEQGTLTSLLHTLFRQAQATFSPASQPASRDPFANPSKPSSASSSSATSSRPPTSLLPSSQTTGFVLLCGLWYLSSAFSSNTGKSILTAFRYPVTLTFIQFFFVSGYSLLILFLRDRLGSRSAGRAAGRPLGGGRRRGSITTLSGWGVRKPTKSMFNGTLVMSLFQIAGHVFSSMAIARVPVSTVHTIKALSPLFTVLSYALIFSVRYTPQTYIALLPLTTGVMLACSFNIRANAMGFLCALGSTFIFVAQNIFSKKLLPKEHQHGHGGAGGGGGEGTAAAGGGGGERGTTSTTAPTAKLDKLNLLFYSSGLAFCLMIPIWLWSDFSALFLSPSPVSSTISSSSASTWTLLTNFLLNGTVHFGQNLLAFSLLARTSPVTYSIASLVKRIAVILIAIVWSHQHVTLLQGMGMTLTFVGLWMYNQAKEDVKQGERVRVKVEKRGEMSLPSTRGDVRAMEGIATPTRSVSPLSSSSSSAAATYGYGQVPPPPPQHANSNGHALAPPPPPHDSHAHPQPYSHPHHLPSSNPPPHHSAYSAHPASASVSSSADDPYGVTIGGGARNRQLSMGMVSGPGPGPSSSFGGLGSGMGMGMGMQSVAVGGGGGERGGGSGTGYR